jgi:hypothetical protein
MTKQFTRAAGILAVLFLFACHPAQRIQKQDAAIDQLKAKWIGDYILSHPCPAMPEINLDSLCALSYTPAPDVSDIRVGDTATTTTGVTHLAGYGLSFAPNPKPQRILVPYEDTRRINLLLDSLRAKDTRIANLQGGRDTKAQDCTADVTAARKEKNKWIWLFIAACAVILTAVAIKIYSLFKPGLKL